MQLLVATDFSEDARNAALRAAALAQERGLGRGTLVHVAPALPPGAEFEARALRALERTLASHADDLERVTGCAFEARLLRGSIVEALLAAAAPPALIVTGARGTHPLRDFALGTTAERLLRQSALPVLVVKRAAVAPYRQVLVPTDFSDEARAALALAARLAPRAELTLAHAFDVPLEGMLQFAGVREEEIFQYRQRARAQARDAMEALIREAALQTRATRLVEQAYPPALIADTEQRIGADLIALGKHGRGRLEKLLIGSVTERVLAAAQCDVLVVPG